MRAARLSAAFFSLLVSAAGQAGAEPPATPAARPESAPQHATAPSLPGQPNKEGVVKPQGGMPMDSEGYAITNRYDPNAAPAKSTAGAPPAPAGGPAAAPAGKAAHAAAPNIPIGPAPTGKGAVTGANYLNIRGELIAIDAGKSVTIRTRTGARNTYTLQPGATVAAGLEPGRTVRVRVLAAEKGKVADRVEIVTPTPVPATSKEQKP